VNLHDFISKHRDELIKRARAKVAARVAPIATTFELSNGVPLFLTQLGDILRQEAALSPPDGTAMGKTAALHGGDLLEQGYSIAQVVHDYGDICQAITELAMDLRLPIGTDDFHTMNRCLDNAIAGAVTEYTRQREVTASGAEFTRESLYASQMRHSLNTAMAAFQAVRSGRVGVSGSTTQVLDRSLREMRELIDRSESEVRLAAGTHHTERLRVAEFITEMESDATIDATNRGLQFSAERADKKLQVDVDRHLFVAAISNLLQNAFKFTRPSGHVKVRIHSAAERVSIEIEDESGGLLPGAAEAMFRPFEEQQHNPEGPGRIGLAITRKAIESDGGKVRLRDIPGQGCVFIVDMPLAVGDAPKFEPPKPRADPRG